MEFAIYIGGLFYLLNTMLSWKYGYSILLFLDMIIMLETQHVAPGS